MVPMDKNTFSLLLQLNNKPNNYNTVNAHLVAFQIISFE